MLFNNLTLSRRVKLFRAYIGLLISVCPIEHGFCVRSNNGDQNSGVIKLNNVDGNTAQAQATCLRLCKSYTHATGCEVIWHQGNRGCYVHTRDIARGNGVARHMCWVFSKCKQSVNTPSKYCWFPFIASRLIDDVYWLLFSIWDWTMCVSPPKVLSACYPFFIFHISIILQIRTWWWYWW